MGTLKGKPRGYFERLLAIDCETTGICYNNPCPFYDGKIRHQVVSWGIIVADAQTLKPIEKLYVRIKWTETSKKQREKDPLFGKEAEGIHGLTFELLEQEGVTEAEAVTLIGSLILKYWGTTGVRTLGHNVHLFDLPFLRDMFDRHGIQIAFGNRHYDTNSIGFATFGTFNSDDLFEALGFAKRGDHNALVDAEQALEATRLIRAVFQKAIND